MAYVEAGPVGGPVALLLHGEPSWSFLYRHVVRVLTESGIRCVVPDLVGFGRSDKPVNQVDYSYARLVEWTRELVFDHLDLREVTLVGQDWGGLIGLRLVAEHPDRFIRVVAANTGLPTGDHDMPEVWWRFRRAVEKAQVLDIGRLVAAGCVRPMTTEVRAAYDAPFPEERAKAGARAMPSLVPTRPDDPASQANRAAWKVLSASDLPVLLRVQRQRPDHRRDGTDPAQPHPRRPRPGPSHHPQRRPLPARRRRRGARQSHRRLHAGSTASARLMARAPR